MSLTWVPGPDSTRGARPAQCGKRTPLLVFIARRRGAGSAPGWTYGRSTVAKPSNWVIASFPGAATTTKTAKRQNLRRTPRAFLVRSTHSLGCLLSKPFHPNHSGSLCSTPSGRHLFPIWGQADALWRSAVASDQELPDDPTELSCESAP